MAAGDVHQPHDGFFKQIFGRPATAAAHFQRYMPSWLAEAADWPALERVSGSFVDASLRQQSSDLLFRVPIQGQFLYLYILFEHQRTPDSWMPLRLLGYMVQIWQHLIKADPKLTRLPPVIPMVLYQGATGWTASHRFRDLLALPQDMTEQFRVFQPDFEHLLLDLSGTRTEELRGDLIGRIALGLMKAVAENRVLEWIETTAPLLAEVLRQPDNVSIFETLLRYVFAVDTSLSYNAIREAIERSPVAPGGERIMSIAEELIAKGRQEGRQEGTHQGTIIGRIQAFQEILGFPVSNVVDLMNKPVSDLEDVADDLRRRIENRSGR